MRSQGENATQGGWGCAESSGCGCAERRLGEKRRPDAALLLSTLRRLKAKPDILVYVDNPRADAGDSAQLK